MATFATSEKSTPGGALSALASSPAETVNAPPAPTVTGLSVTSGSTAGGTQRHHHRDRLQRGHRGEVRHRGRHRRRRELDHLDHRDLAGGVGGHRRRDGHRGGGHQCGQPAQRPVHLQDPDGLHHRRGQPRLGPGVALTTLAVSPKTVGDVMVVGIMGQTLSVSSISGGGVTTWKKAAQFQGAEGNDVELWYGTVTSTGAPAPSPSRGRGPWPAGSSTPPRSTPPGWGLATVWAATRPGPSTGPRRRACPSRASPATGSGELYVGFSVVANTASHGEHHGLHLRRHLRRQRPHLRHQRVGDRGPDRHPVTGGDLLGGGAAAHRLERCSPARAHRHRR